MADKELYDQDFNDELNLSRDVDDLADNFELPEDNVFLNDELDENDSYTESDVNAIPPNASPNPSSMMDFIKSYGLMIIGMMVFVYFGLKYSLGVMFDSGKTPTVQTTDNNSSTPVDTTSMSGTVVADDTSSAPSGTIMPELSTSQTSHHLDNLGAPITPVGGSSEAAGAPTAEAPAMPTAEAPAMPTAEATAMPIPSSSDNARISATVDTNSSPINEQQLKDLDAKISAISQSVEELNKILASQQDNVTALAELKKQISDVDAKVNTGNDVSGLKDQISKFSTQNEQLLIYVQGVGKALGMLSDQVKKQEAVLASFISENVGNPVTKQSGQSGLVVEAVISGRAWLRSVTGQAFSVTIGDKIPGYGKVIKIDSTKGTLTTDSGVVLTQ